MWGWFIDNSVWILIFASVVVVLLLFFNDRIRRFFAKVDPDKVKTRIWRNITAIFRLAPVCLKENSIVN